jgi:hypothetical protein
MISDKNEYCHCPHCNRETRHSIVRERVLAPVMWCLSCFRARVEGKKAYKSMASISAASIVQGTKTRATRAKRSGASVAR